MAQQGIELKEEDFSCAICLDLLKDPVTIPCGHSYCMSCVKNHWDGEDMKNIHSCPQCRQTFAPRPVLVKNTMLADLVHQLKKAGLEPAAADHCYAGPEDVACDVCTGRKLKAVKSCLQCVVSYCHKHLQPHLDVPQLKKHKLVEPSQRLQENVCSRHDEVMKIFCRTDQQCICYLCSMDEHKDHDTVSSAAERVEKETELEVSRQKIQQKIKDKRKNLKVLKRKVKVIRRSADEAVEKSNKMFTEMIRLMEERRSDVERQIRSEEETEVGGVKELEAKLEQEVTELRRKDGEMDKLSHTDDHNQFLLQYPSVSKLSEDPDSANINIRPRRYFEGVVTAVTELRDKLQHSLREGWTHTSMRTTTPQPEPQTRAELLQYSCDITLDPNTVNELLSLSEDNKRVTGMRQRQNHPDHPHRFSHWYQVLNRQSLTGRCYWEVEVEMKVEGSGGDWVDVAVAYQDIQRKGSSGECRFGSNDKSWALFCTCGSFVFCHNGVQSPVPGPGPGPGLSRVGVYLDHTAGTLSFYRVSETTTLIHRVQTTFTQPLYAGLGFGLRFAFVLFGSTAHFPKLQ